MRIHRSEITKDRWVNTSYLRTDGKEEFREPKKLRTVYEGDVMIGEENIW